MKLHTGEEEFNLGFQNPTEGISLMQLQEGVQLYINDETHSESLIVPMQVVKVFEGEDENLERKASLFVNLITKEGEANAFGEKTVCNILTLTNLAKKFEKKFPGDTAFNSDEFLTALKLKLPGAMIKVKHELDSKDRFQAVKLFKVTKKDSAVEEPADKEEPAADKEAGGDDDGWD